MEIIGFRPFEKEVDYGAMLEAAMSGGGFLPFRVRPGLRDEVKFGPNQVGARPPVGANFFEVPAGYQLKDLPQVMSDRVIRGPLDIREVFATGSLINEAKCDFAIYAPEITGGPDLLLRIQRYEDWSGLGLTVQRFDPDEKNVWDLKWIGFSDQ